MMEAQLASATKWFLNVSSRRKSKKVDNIKELKILFFTRRKWKRKPHTHTHTHTHIHTHTPTHTHTHTHTYTHTYTHKHRLQKCHCSDINLINFEIWINLEIKMVTGEKTSRRRKTHRKSSSIIPCRKTRQREAI
jgi:ABC-type Zn2+ transport system substrate-binding protein/surface adhesin